MKLGILGTGMIVKDVLSFINDIHFESISILGTESTRDETLKLVTQCNNGFAYFDYDELLESDVDTIYVALPNHLHYTFALKALHKGKHVIIEKPIVLRAQELEKLSAIAYEKKLILLEAMNIHYLNSYNSLRKDIKKLGDIKLVSLNYSQLSSRYEDFKNNVIHPAFDARKGGGALMDINIYNLHFIVGLFGMPVTVNYEANVVRGVDVSGMLFLDYGDKKVVCIGAKDCHAPTFSSIQGEHGCILLNKPANQMVGYELKINSNPAESIEHIDAHRLIPEFKKFKEIIENRDFHTASSMLSVSIAVLNVIEMARHQQNLEVENV
ncbi:TPA: Gfo/Idh/MocA family oxidoreductase [Klebsiella pneumoniae]|nr:Gfo/Idh/MocA family oxidoreductase [Klebsiella pneumoniae]